MPKQAKILNHLSFFFQNITLLFLKNFAWQVMANKNLNDRLSLEGLPSLLVNSETKDKWDKAERKM